MIHQASEQDLAAVREIVRRTIGAVYPRYYPAGVVSFFLAHHSDEAVLRDLSEGLVFLLADDEGYAGTVTIRENEICRLFVLPEKQHRGYGRALLGFAERQIGTRFPVIVLDASLPARGMYLRHGYREREHHEITTDGGDVLCYDVMEKETGVSSPETDGECTETTAGREAPLMNGSKKKRYTISVGLNDKDEKTQRVRTESVLRLVTNCCKGYGMAFSSYLQEGGYIHENDTYVTEKSVCIVLIDPEEALIRELAKDLCAFMNQESVMVTAEEVECCFISESL